MPKYPEVKAGIGFQCYDQLNEEQSNEKTRNNYKNIKIKSKSDVKEVSFFLI